MATLRDMAFDYSMQRGHGKKSYKHYLAGAKAVIQEIIDAGKISETAMEDRVNSFIEDLKGE